MKADYGIDMPRALRLWGVSGSALFACGFAVPGNHPLRSPIIFGGVLGLATTAVRFVGSRFGKLRLGDQAVEALRLTGTERVLDAGCGRGLLMMRAAKRLTTGRAIGVDIWRKDAIWHNHRNETLYNARAEKVEERIEVHTADMRNLPFDDATFDAAMASWSLSCLAHGHERRNALNELFRVLRPGGMLLILDTISPTWLAGQLTELGAVDVNVGAPSFIFGLPSRQVSARRPLDPRPPKP